VQSINLTRSMTNKTCDFVVDRLRAAYMYFAIPRCSDGPLYDAVVPYRLSIGRNTFTRIVCVIEDGSRFPVIILDGSDADNFSPKLGMKQMYRCLRLDMTQHMEDFNENLQIKSVLQTDAFLKIADFLPTVSYCYSFNHLSSLPGQVRTCQNFSINYKMFRLVSLRV